MQRLLKCFNLKGSIYWYDTIPQASPAINIFYFLEANTGHFIYINHVDAGCNRIWKGSHECRRATCVDRAGKLFVLQLQDLYLHEHKGLHREPMEEIGTATRMQAVTDKQLWAESLSYPEDILSGAWLAFSPPTSSNKVLYYQMQACHWSMTSWLLKLMIPYCMAGIFH